MDIYLGLEVDVCTYMFVEVNNRYPFLSMNLHAPSPDIILF